MTRAYEFDKTDTPIKQGMSYYEARDIRKKSLGGLLSDELLKEGSTIGGSVKKAISDKTRATMKGVKQKFDPLNLVKFMTFGSNLAPAILGKMTGRSQEDMRFFTGKDRATQVGEKATKVGQVEGAGDEGLIAVLSQIYSLLKSSHENEIQRRELDSNKFEEKEMENERRHKDLLKALGVVTGKDKTAEESPEPNMSFGDVITEILTAFGGLETVIKVGKWFVTGAGATLLGIVAAGALGGWLGEKFKEWRDDQAQEMGGSKAAAAMAKMKSIDDTDSVAYKQAEQEYNQAIKEKQELVRQFLEKKGYKTYLKTNLVGQETGQYYYEKNGNAPTKEEMKEAAQFADQQTTTAEKVTPTPAAAPTTSGESVATPTAAASAAPTTSTPPSAKVNSAISENNNLQLADKTAQTSSTSLDSQSTVNVEMQQQAYRGPMPTVRNIEMTFQRMILNSTRVA